MAFVSIDARFKPLSLDEYLKPALMHQAAYEQYDQGLEDLATDASKYSQYIPKDSQAYATQQQYMQELKDIANTLYNEGMNINNNFSTVRALRKQYIDTVLPINNAAQKLEAYNKEARDLQSKGLYVYGMPNIDDLIKDPTVTYKMFDPKTLEEDGMKAGASELTNSPYKHMILGAVDPYHDVYSQVRELDPEIKQAVVNGKYKQFDNYLKAKGIDPNANPEAYQAGMTFLTNGFIVGASTQREDKLIDNVKAKADLEVNTYSRKKAIDYSYAQKEKQNDANAKFLALYQQHATGQLDGIKAMPGFSDKSTGYRGHRWQLTNDEANTRLSNTVKSGINKDNKKTVLHKLDDTGQQKGKVNIDDIGAYTDFGTDVVYRDGRQTFILTANAVDKAGNGMYRVELDPNLISSTAGTYFKDMNNKIHNEGGYNKREKTRLKLKKTIFGNGLSFDEYMKFIGQNGNINPLLYDIVYEPGALLLHQSIGESLQNVVPVPSFTGKK